MTKLPAGNSHRHQQPEDSTLWDRLRADLNNLGAAYGPITEGVGESVSDVWVKFAHTWVPIENQHRVRCAHCNAVCSPDNTLVSGCVQPPATGRELLAAVNKVTRGDAAAIEARKATRKGYTIASDSDRNAYFDGIILAARKKREALAWMDEPLTDDERDICHAMWDEQDRAEKVSAAMSRPLDWEPRVGHKGVETG